MSKATITIEINRLPNGVVQTRTQVEGEGFQYYELIGTLEIVKSDMIEKSKNTAQEIIDKEGKDA